MESFLYARERDLFALDEVITLYGLTNTYFEGSAKHNANAAFGRSKEKRSDCPLVTLALTLDASGFPKRSEVFAGNAVEADTLARMVRALTPEQQRTPPTVVLDAGIATEENIAWLVEQGYRYVVVSRKRHLEFDPEAACLIKEDGPLTIRAQRVVRKEKPMKPSCIVTPVNVSSRIAVLPIASRNASSRPCSNSPMGCTSQAPSSALRKSSSASGG